MLKLSPRLYVNEDHIAMVTRGRNGDATIFFRQPIILSETKDPSDPDDVESEYIASFVLDKLQAPAFLEMLDRISLTHEDLETANEMVMEFEEEEEEETEALHRYDKKNLSISSKKETDFN